MKTTYIYIVLTLVLSVSLQGQTTSTSVGNEAYKGIENTFHDFKDDAIETVSDIKDKSGEVLDDIKEGIDKIGYLEKFMRGDIRLKMVGAEAKSGRDTQLEGTPFEHYRYLTGKDEIDAQFDWDNRALSMKVNTVKEEHMWDTKTEGGKPFHESGGSHMQYTDKDGYWYTPVEDMEGYENIKYIKFNAKQMAVDKLNEWLDLSIDLMTNKLAVELIGIASTFDITNPIMNFGAEGPLYAILVSLIEENFDHYESRGDKALLEIQEKLKEAIEILLREELELIGGFPIFIHWAFLYSPEFIRAHYGNKINETKSDCEGYTNACSKFTVLKGPDKGKSMSFDRYGRLTFINSLKDGTAQFFYDKDITVTLPDPSVVMSLSDLTGDIFKQRNMEDNYKKQQEELDEEMKEFRKEIEKLNKNEEVIEYLKEKISELEIKKEQAVTKKDTDKYQEIIDELKKILDKKNKENVIKN